MKIGREQLQEYLEELRKQRSVRKVAVVFGLTPESISRHFRALAEDDPLRIEYYQLCGKAGRPRKYKDAREKNRECGKRSRQKKRDPETSTLLIGDIKKKIDREMNPVTARSIRRLIKSGRLKETAAFIEVNKMIGIRKDLANLSVWRVAYEELCELSQEQRMHLNSRHPRAIKKVELI